MLALPQLRADLQLNTSWSLFVLCLAMVFTCLALNKNFFFLSVIGVRPCVG